MSEAAHRPGCSHLRSVAAIMEDSHYFGARIMVPYFRPDIRRKEDGVEMKSYMQRVSCRNRQEEYLDRLQKINSAFPHFGTPHGPSKITQGIYMGTTADAENTRLLHRLEITHVINCSAVRKTHFLKDNYPYTASEHGVIGYVALHTFDDDDYDIRGHFYHVANYMRRARMTGGNVLVCGNGCSASTTFCIVYLLLVKNMFLLEAAKLVKDERRIALCNVNYMQQLVEFAADEGLLDPEPDRIKTLTYGTALDKRRLHDVHLPDIRLV